MSSKVAGYESITEEQKAAAKGEITARFAADLARETADAKVNQMAAHKGLNPDISDNNKDIMPRREEALAALDSTAAPANPLNIPLANSWLTTSLRDIVGTPEARKIQASQAQRMRKTVAQIEHDACLKKNLPINQDVLDVLAEEWITFSDDDLDHDQLDGNPSGEEASVDGNVSSDEEIDEVELEDFIGYDSEEEKVKLKKWVSRKRAATIAKKKADDQYEGGEDEGDNAE